MSEENLYILSIETSGKNCSVALSKNNDIIYYANVEEANQHDRRLAELIQSGINEINGHFDTLDAIAVSAGPGSFTGLRIGVSIAKGLTFGTELKLIAVPTIEAVAFWYLPELEKSDATLLCSIVHSHKDFFYTQSFNKNFKKIDELNIRPFIDINPDKDDLLLVGPGINLVNSDKQNKEFSELNAKMISKLAYKFYCEKKFVAPDDLIPYYAQEFKPKQLKEY